VERVHEQHGECNELGGSVPSVAAVHEYRRALLHPLHASTATPRPIATTPRPSPTSHSPVGRGVQAAVAHGTAHAWRGGVGSARIGIAGAGQVE
jgi:hypothetical protein